MLSTPARLTAIAWCCAAVFAPCRAESLASSASSAGSSASSAGSASSGSVSDSLNNSSRGSTGTNTADDDYRVIDVAELADRPGVLQLTLRATDTEREFTLKLPRQALVPRGIAAGDVVQVRNRDYGLEFARTGGAAGTREPFFLVLHDAVQRELAARPVSL